MPIAAYLGLEDNLVNTRLQNSIQSLGFRGIARRKEIETPAVRIGYACGFHELFLSGRYRTSHPVARGLKLSTPSGVGAGVKSWRRIWTPSAGFPVDESRTVFH